MVNKIQYEIYYLTNNDAIDAWEYRVSIGRALSYIEKLGGVEDCTALCSILNHFGCASMCDNWARKWYYPAIYNDMKDIVYCDMMDYPFDNKDEVIQLLTALDDALKAEGVASDA